MPGRRLLIIDDDDDIRETLEEIMTFEGFQVSVARSGHAALTDLTYRELRPNAILVDLFMPSMSGDQFLSVVKRHPDWSRIPVIICSAGVVPEDIARGVFAIAKKPFDLAHLIDLVRRAVAHGVMPE